MSSSVAEIVTCLPFLFPPAHSTPGNQNESTMLRDALPQLTAVAKAVGLVLQGNIASLDGIYDSRANRKAIFNRGMTPNINANPRGRKNLNVGASRYSFLLFSKNGSIPSNIENPQPVV